MQTWTSRQLRRFLAHAASEQPARGRVDEHGDPVTVPADRLHPVYLELATTGVRRGEVCGLRWDDVDLDRRRISIRQAQLVVDHLVHVDTPKSRRGVRNVALDAETVPDLFITSSGVVLIRMTAKSVLTSGFVIVGGSLD